MDYTLDARLTTIKTAAADDGEWGDFTGILSTDEEDLHSDRIAPGAFGNDINPAHVALLHGHDSSTEGVIGKWVSIRSVGSRLEGAGRLFLGIPRAAHCYRLLKAGVLNAISVGFRIMDPTKDISVDAKGRRTIRRAKLCEASFVAVPANQSCRITSVKSYNPHNDTTANVDRIVRKLKMQDQVVREVFDDLELKIGQYVASAAARGEISETKAANLLREMRDDMKARL